MAGIELRRFCLAVLGVEGDVDVARQDLLAVVGEAATAEAAGVVAQFDAINRVADATGTQLDQIMEDTMPLVLEGIDLADMRQA